MSGRRTSLRLIIHGHVQGVFYRDWTVQSARELGLSGWVKNQPDGTVAALLQGEDHAVRTMIGRMQSGPPAARVERIEEQECEAEELAGFERR